MKNVKIENVEYIVNAIPPYLQYVTDYLAEITPKKAKTLSEAKQFAQEAEECLTQIINETTSPEPPKHLYLTFYNIAIDETNRALEAAESFRPTPQPKQSPKKTG